MSAQLTVQRLHLRRLCFQQIKCICKAAAQWPCPCLLLHVLVCIGQAIQTNTFMQYWVCIMSVLVICLCLYSITEFCSVLVLQALIQITGNKDI
jgi:hypothetical protein